MRIRLIFSKTEAMRFTGHLDLHKAWERTFRRSGLSLAYSQGFHPQPRLNLACALPLGFTSQCELLDAWLTVPVPPDQVHQGLIAAVPPGIIITALEEITDRQPALQTQVASAEYTIALLDVLPDLPQHLNILLASPTLLRQRRGKDYDLRPLIESIAPMPTDETGLPRFHLRLSAREAATGRPEEVLSVLGIPLTSARIHRTALILRKNSDHSS